MPEEKKEGLRRFKKIVLDLGSGSAMELSERARREPDVLFVGVDSNIHAIRRAMEKSRRHPNLRFILADASQLPIKTESMHEATGKFFFGKLEKREVKITDKGKMIMFEPADRKTYDRVVDEIFRALGPGKRFKSYEGEEEGAEMGREALKRSRFKLMEERRFALSPPFIAPNVVEKWKKPKQKKRGR